MAFSVIYIPIMFENVTTSLARALACVIQAIWDTLSTHAPHATTHAQARAYGIPAATPLLRRIQDHIARLVFRLERLVQRHDSGRLAPPRPRAPRPDPKPRERQESLPRARAWLIRHVQRTAQFTGQVEAFLARPDAQALVATAPQAGRILRPLCHMLGLDAPPWLRLPGTPARQDPCPRRERRRYRRLNPIPWLTQGQAIAAPQPQEPAAPKPWRMVYE